MGSSEDLEKSKKIKKPQKPFDLRMTKSLFFSSKIRDEQGVYDIELFDRLLTSLELKLSQLSRSRKNY